MTGAIPSRSPGGAGGGHHLVHAPAFKLPDKSFELPVMGTFEVSGGKINAWRD
jgi:hypothetical protein